MINLPGGFRCSEPVVIPTDWQHSAASMQKDWCIFYRFYDRSDCLKKVTVKGMNEAKTWPERKGIARVILADVLAELKAGYNPLTKEFFRPGPVGAMLPTTPILTALDWAAREIPVEECTRIGFGTVLNYVRPAVQALGLAGLGIGDVKRAHIRAILNQVGRVKKVTPVIRRGKKTGEIRDKWTANNFNYYRVNLGILFSYLMEEEVIEANPAYAIKKAKRTKRMREVLTDEQRPIVDAYLLKKSPEFHRLHQIFYHSGSRETEMLRVKGQDVNLKLQYFKRLIKKGREFREIVTTIQDIALPYWKELMATCGPEDYIFSKRFCPGAVQIKTEIITKTWFRYVKRDLGFTADFYAGKHLKASEMAEELGDQSAASHMGHTSTAMLKKTYDTTRGAREHERKKKSGKAF